MAPVTRSTSHMSVEEPSNSSSNQSISTSTNGRYGRYEKLELLRLITQCLDGMGYASYTKQLKEIDGNKDNEMIERFFTCIQDGQFEEAEALIPDLQLSSSKKAHSDIIVKENENYDAVKICFLLRRHQYLEYLFGELDQDKSIRYLRTLFNQFTLEPNVLRKMSSFLSLPDLSKIELQDAGWYGSISESRSKLIDTIELHVSPHLLIPKNRLLKLLDQSVEFQKYQNLYLVRDNPGDIKPEVTHQISLYTDLKSSRDDFPKNCIHELTEHSDEVWFVKFSNTGKYLCSTSKDSKTIIYDVYNNFKIKHVLIDYKQDVSSKAVLYASWSPNDTYLITCGFDLYFRIWDVETGSQLRKIKFYDSIRVWSCEWLPDSSGFITLSPDKKLVWFKMTKNDCKEYHSWDLTERIEDLSVTKDGSKLVTVNHSCNSAVYDLKKKTKTHSCDLDRKLTSVVTSLDSKYCIINLAPEEIQLWDIQNFRLVSKYYGQRQQGEFVIRSCFGNWDDSFILSGSEDGRIYIWNREFGNLIFALDGHKGLVNDVDWNKKGNGYFGRVFASAGDDHIVRIWGV